MAQTTQAINREDLEAGFTRGVTRAEEGGLDSSEASRFHDELIGFLEARLNAMASNEKGRPLWNPRAVRHIAENLTTFEIAWRNDSNANSLSIEPYADAYLAAFQRAGNCWSHR